MISFFTALNETTGVKGPREWKHRNRWGRAGFCFFPFPASWSLWGYTCLFQVGSGMVSVSGCLGPTVQLDGLPCGNSPGLWPAFGSCRWSGWWVRWKERNTWLSLPLPPWVLPAAPATQEPLLPRPRKQAGPPGQDQLLDLRDPEQTKLWGSCSKIMDNSKTEVVVV